MSEKQLSDRIKCWHEYFSIEELKQLEQECSVFFENALGEEDKKLIRRRLREGKWNTDGGGE
jgi:hypothetical protein